MQVAWKRVIDFAYRIQSDEWLTVLRIGLAIQVLLYCLFMRSDWNYLLAGTGRGLISRDLSEAALSGESSLIPRLGWLVKIGSHFGLSEAVMLDAAWLCLLCAACFLVVGLFSRTAAILTWFFHLCAVKSGGLLAYGMDNFTTIGLFYLMLSPLPDRCSLDYKFRNVGLKNPQLQGLFRRVLQVHLCIIYFFGGLAKCAGPDWWNGNSLWRSLTNAPFNIISPEILVKWKDFFPIAGISVWLIEIGYPFFIWSKRTRLAWLICVLLMHIGIGLFMGMYLFASVMIILNVAAFGPEIMGLRGRRAANRADVHLTVPAQ
jgi:Vitamin K-dependent gamma-carboxylase